MKTCSLSLDSLLAGDSDFPRSSLSVDNVDSLGYLFLLGKLPLGMLQLGSVLTERTALDDLLLKVVIGMGIKTALYRR